MVINDTGFDNHFLLSSESLKEFDSWTASGRLYLNEHPQGVRLLPLVNNYQFAVAQFYQWLGTAVVQEHLSDFLIYDQARQAFEAWLANWPHLST